MKINYWQDLEPNVIYHLYNHAIGKDNLFCNDGNYSFFIEKWKQYLPYLDVFAFCLMPNHFHFLVRIKAIDPLLDEHVKSQGTVSSQKFYKREITYTAYLEDQFKRFFSSYALAFNKQQGRHGSLFQKSFKRISVNTEFRLQYLLAYIHHNPMHHGFCKRYEEWPFSSWSAFQNMEKASSINRNEVLSWFGEDLIQAREQFLKYHNIFRMDNQYVHETFEVS